MTQDGELRAAVAAGVLGSEQAHTALLQSIVEVARAIFGAQAASIFLLDEDADELVFEAVAGEGEGELVGPPLPLGHRRRRLGARHAPAARARRSREGPAVSRATPPRARATCPRR